MTFNVNKVNGSTMGGDFVGGGMDFIIITSTVNFLATVGAPQAALDKLIEVVSLNAQPIILAAPYVDPVSSAYVLKIATQHTGAWSAANLLAAIVADQYAGMGFTSGNTTVSVTVSDPGLVW
jgi:uncharacterized ion transporter superfamily protein YfcC